MFCIKNSFKLLYRMSSAGSLLNKENEVRKSVQYCSVLFSRAILWKAAKIFVLNSNARTVFMGI